MSSVRLFLLFSLLITSVGVAADGYRRTSDLSIQTIPGDSSGNLISVRYIVTNTYNTTIDIVVSPNAAGGLEKDGFLHRSVPPHGVANGRFIVKPGESQQATLYYRITPK